MCVLPVLLRSIVCNSCWSPKAGGWKKQFSFCLKRNKKLQWHEVHSSKIPKHKVDWRKQPILTITKTQLHDWNFFYSKFVLLKTHISLKDYFFCNALICVSCNVLKIFQCTEGSCCVLLLAALVKGFVSSSVHVFKTCTSTHALNVTNLFETRYFTTKLKNIFTCCVDIMQLTHLVYLMKEKNVSTAGMTPSFLGNLLTKLFHTEIIVMFKPR